MTVVLARVDDRLIHGQVTVGWCQQLHPDRILLADNAVAADAWQARVYASSVPPHIAATIASVAEAVNLLCSGPADERVLLLTGSVSAMADLVRMGAPVTRVNLGGLHIAPGRREVLPFVYLDDLEAHSLMRILTAGVSITAQQVPGGREFVVDEALVRDFLEP